MFKVTRTYPAPDSIATKQYNKDDVLKRLKPIFFEKCYLCERDDIQDVEVEHFVPHQSNSELKYDWDNLYYSCSRCNSIKSNKYINLLDCADSSIDVGNLIRCLMPSTPDGKVKVEATNIKTQCNKTENTVKLLEECYNLENTALRGISREALMEQMWEHYTDLLLARQVLRKKKSGRSDKKRAEETIEAMLDVEHPFSTFWRYYYLNDSFLTKHYSQLRIGF
ncbi:HNH endonuclease [Vibrio alginolyticus]|uniref:HNH endonuclease n=1 Tax=Vibrio alginolyticus TaxID=663 RepID=UPI001BD4B3DA|nr:HNH endonuclease [Vibrio alginolyticus]ELB2829349.1 HNH endonuclease [Vibrio alginolyticus]MBT0029657.1 HNH endonuclease [Vibrio alginolyticus]